jgi:hypothetical protein
MSGAIRSLLQQHGDSKNVSTELARLETAISEIGKSNGSGTLDGVIAELQKVQNDIAGLQKGGGTVTSGDIEKSLLFLVEMAARQYLFSVKALTHQVGKNFAVTADAAAAETADAFFTTGKINFEKM